MIAVTLVSSLPCDAHGQADARRRRANPPAATPPAPTVDPIEVHYREIIARAVGEFSAGNYGEAITLFEEAYGVRPSARALRGVAKSRFELRQYVRTVDACDAALAATVDPLDPELRAEIEELRTRANTFVGSIRVSAAPASAEVSLDGRLLSAEERAVPIRIDQGPHNLDANAVGFAPSHRQVDVAGGAEQPVMLRLVSLTAERRPLRWAGIGTAGAGALGMILSGVWVANRGNALDECGSLAARGGECSNASTIAAQRNHASGMLVLSSVTLAAGAGLFVVDILTHHDDSTEVACTPVRGGMMCGGVVTW